MTSNANLSGNFMTNTEKIVTKTKEYILKLYLESYATHHNMVTGLKNGIDFFVGRKDGFETIKVEILATCLAEFEERTRAFGKLGHLKMADAIKTSFVKFVNELSVDERTNVLPISFERRLKEYESKSLEKSLKEKFDFGSWKDQNYYWEPLCKTQNKIQSIYFENEIFKLEDNHKLIDLLKSISGNRIFLFTEESINYEIDTSLFDIAQAESAFCDIKTNWLIYISHEGTITFAGEELISAIEKKWIEILKQKNPWN